MADITVNQGHVINSKTVNTRNWHAWNNLMPPPPYSFFVVGEVEVPNPGVEALLVPKVPQGTNPAILMLDLHLIQKPGVWPQNVTWVQARYEKIITGKQYSEVEIFYNNQRIALIPVIDVH